jgi:hypothetical protein
MGSGVAAGGRRSRTGWRKIRPLAKFRIDPPNPPWKGGLFRILQEVYLESKLISVCEKIGFHFSFAFNLDQSAFLKFILIRFVRK